MTILVFGAGDNQRSLIRAARAEGFRTVAIDPNPGAPGAADADVFEVVSARDFAGTIAVCHRHGVDGIVTCQMENPLLLMARVAEDLGCIFPAPGVVARARDKWLMKQAFMEHGVACARGLRFEPGQAITPDALEQLTWPLILKPTDAFSSRGVFRVENITDIERREQVTRDFSSTRTCIVEEFLEGPEVSVESVTFRGTTTVMQITDKVITPYPTTVEMAHIQPSEHPPEVQDAITRLVKAAITALGLDNCASHAEVKLTTAGPVMVEIGARLGGDYITSHLVPLSTGRSIEAAAARIALGLAPETAPMHRRGAVIRYLDRGDGVVHGVGSLAPVLAMEGVQHAGIAVHEGMPLPRITDSARRHGFVICDGATRGEAWDRAGAALDILRTLITLG